MSANPYLIPTGAIFGYHTKLKDSYAYSQVLEISNILMPLIAKDVKLFSDDEKKQYVLCKKLIENLQSLMKRKLDIIPEYQLLKVNYDFISKKIDERVQLTRNKYEEAIKQLKVYEIENKTNVIHLDIKNAFVKNHIQNIENYLSLCTSLDLLDNNRRQNISQELMNYRFIFAVRK